MYAVGWTMHTVGSQIIRTAAILQLLLGNIGRPGGGINALRGHANVQGATDHAIVAGILPGYLKVPTPPQTSLAAHLGDSTPRPLVPDTVNYWGNYPKFYVSQMKAWFGEHATRDNEFAYDYLAKQDGDATWLTIWDKARQGTLEGFVALGFNPLLAGPDVPRLLDAMTKLKWKVVIDPFMLDSAEFWKAPGMDPAEIDTEVLYLPSSHWIERDGSFTNSGRWAQWKEKAIDPPLGVRSDTWILSELFWRVKELYQAEGGAWNEAIQHLTWEYLNPREPTLVELAKEINGYDRQSGRLLSSFGELADDRHDDGGELDLHRQLHRGGQPDAAARNRRPDGPRDAPRLGVQLAGQPPRALQPRLRRRRRAALGSDAGPASPGTGASGSATCPTTGGRRRPMRPGAFIMTEEGVARLFSSHLADGPFSEHYEPVESPSPNVLHDGVPVNPVIRWYGRRARDARHWRRRVPVRLHHLPRRRAGALRPRATCRTWSRRCPTSSSRCPRGWRRRRGFRTAARCASGRSGAKCRGRRSSPSGSSRSA